MLILQRTVRKKERGKQQQKRGAGGTLTSSQKDWDGDVWVYKIGLKCNGNQVSLSERDRELELFFYGVFAVGRWKGGGGGIVYTCMCAYVHLEHALILLQTIHVT